MKINNFITSITIGSFDGIHLAHQKLINHSEAVVVIEHKRGRLTPGFKRSWYCKKPIYFFMLEKIRNMSSKEFIKYLKYSFPNLKKIVVGYDFGFGKNRSGNLKNLREFFDGEVLVIDEVKLNGISIHSRTIHKALIDGELEFANRMLGRFYKIDGFQIRGQGLGKDQFVPTINLKVQDYTLPKSGVYGSFTKIGEKKYKSITFLGNRVSTDGSFAVETHILENFFEKDLSYKRIFIEFVEFIRENRKFENFKELKKQIFSDIKRAKKLLEKGDNFEFNNAINGKK